MQMNFLVIGLTALVPMLVGFIWYHPNVMGKMWMEACGFKEDDLKGGNMALIMGISLILSFLLAFSLQFMVIHQFALFSIVENHPAYSTPGTPENTWMMGFLKEHEHCFRSFKHGALHGFIGSVFTILPVLGTNALFERKGGKYIFVNWAYWAITMTIMGGILGQWA
ncbi:MAG: DUF1761 domain-containing protein [Bacteroidetes bacterium]|nr:DUF1761 domain-containing protein [Bacteroidota bacterium]